MFKSFTPINLTLLRVCIHRSEAKEWISKGREKAQGMCLTSAVISPEWRNLQRRKQISSNRMDQCASGIQYNSSQKVLKWGRPSDLIWKATLNCVTLFWIWSDNWNGLSYVNDIASTESYPRSFGTHFFSLILFSLLQKGWKKKTVFGTSCR